MLIQAFFVCRDEAISDVEEAQEAAGDVEGSPKVEALPSEAQPDGTPKEAEEPSAPEDVALVAASVAAAFPLEGPTDGMLMEVARSSSAAAQAAARMDGMLMEVARSSSVAAAAQMLAEGGALAEPSVLVEPSALEARKAQVVQHQVLVAGEALAERPALAARKLAAEHPALAAHMADLGVQAEVLRQEPVVRTAQLREAALRHLCKPCVGRLERKPIRSRQEPRKPELRRAWFRRNKRRYLSSKRAVAAQTLRANNLGDNDIRHRFGARPVPAKCDLADTAPNGPASTASYR